MQGENTIRIICVVCLREKVDGAYTGEVVDIADGVRTSHGICPSCALECYGIDLNEED